MIKYLTMAILSAMICSAQEKALVPSKADDWLGDRQLLTVSGPVFRISGSNSLVSKNILPVDPSKKYRISGFFKLADGCEATRFYLGIVPMDEERRRIEPKHVLILSGSDTELSRSCQIGSREFWVRFNAGWRPDRLYVAAFNSDPSGNLKDLPNFDVTPGNIIKVETVGGELKVTLSHPLESAWPQGTGVRIHQLGPNYIYVLPKAIGLQKDWKPFGCTIHGESLDTFGNRMFPRGTRNARIVILANHGMKNAVMEFKDVILSELPDK